MKKGLTFTKEQLEELYFKEKLSLNEIGRQFDCEGTNILYWMKKFNIKRRPADYGKADIPKALLHDLYITKKLSSLQIAEKLGTVNSRTIRKKLKKFGIQTRSISESNTKKFKAPFSENLEEKAYFLGLRAGDFYAKWARKSIRLQTTTTHTAQIGLLKSSIAKYGEIRTYYSRHHAREDEWFIYTDLDSSFKFLLKKPQAIPSWILENDHYFYQFLAAYVDCEGTFTVIRSHKTGVRFIFRIKTGDVMILQQIHAKLRQLGYTAQFYLGTPKGKAMGPFGKNNHDIYDLAVYRKKEVLRLIKKLLPLCKHSEKIRKMQFMLKHKDSLWHEAEEGWQQLREEIKGELLKNTV